MTEVRKHQRQTASGKRTTVRHHTRGGEKTDRREDEAEAAREAWADRNAPHVSTLGGETDPQPEEWWAEDDMPPPGAFWADDDEVGNWHGVVNRAPAYRPQGDHDFA